MKQSTARIAWIGGIAAAAVAAVGGVVLLTTKSANAAPPPGPGPSPSPGPGPGPGPVANGAIVDLVPGSMPTVLLTAGGDLEIDAPADPGPPSLRPEIVSINADNLSVLGLTMPLTGAGTSAGLPVYPGSANVVVDWSDSNGNAQQSTFQLVVVPATGQ